MGVSAVSFRCSQTKSIASTRQLLVHTVLKAMVKRQLERRIATENDRKMGRQRNAKKKPEKTLFLPCLSHLQMQLMVFFPFAKYSVVFKR